MEAVEIMDGDIAMLPGFEAESPLCLSCTHFVTYDKPKDLFICDAYASGIPKKIISGEVQHTESYPGDGGITYEKIKGQR